MAAGLFLVLATLQVAIPAHATLEPRPARFGWQMYSTKSHVPEVWTEDATGSRTAVEVGQLMGDGRAEIHWTEPLASALCMDEQVRAVVVIEGETEERILCS